MKSYKNLEVWKKSINLVKEIYSLTAEFPAEERYGLISQIRRAAVSVPSNLAEGQVKISEKEFLRFIEISYGSLAELDTQIIIAKELSYLTEESALTLSNNIAEIGKMLNGLSNSMRKKAKLEIVSDNRKLTTKN